MLKQFTILLSVLMLFSVTIIADDTSTIQSELSEIEMSGFMDFVSSYSESNNDKTNIGLGQAEIDLAKDLSSSSAIELAIAYNSDDGLFELGAAILDLHFFSSTVGERHTKGFKIDHSSLQIGMFDVPFGIDYNSYASVDRKLISAPRVVEFTHEGWNDLGFNLTLESNIGNASFFVVNGFESSAEISSQVINLATGLPEEQIEEVNTTPANAFGGRVAFNIFSNLEIGTSGAIGINADSKDEMTLVGVDLQFNLNNLLIKGEYIQHSINRSIQEETNKGYYIQSLYNFESFFLTSRYGSFQPEGIEWVGQLSIGGGMPITSGVEARIETLIHETSANNRTMLQIVTEF